MIAFIYILCTALPAFLICYMLLPVLIKHAVRLKLVDKPNHRSSHQITKPSMGGIAIVISILSVLFLNYQALNTYLPLFLGLLSLFTLGLIDDKLNLNAKLKLIIQLVVSFTYLYHQPQLIELCSKAFSVSNQVILFAGTIGMAGLINAFNLIDGIDGLAGGISVINFSVLALLFFSISSGELSLISLTIVLSSLAFLFFNFHPSKIFMGDCGSLALGFLLSVLCLKYIELSELSNASLNICFAIVLLPIFDTARLFLVRILKKASPFSADRRHAHHLLLKNGMNHGFASFTIYVSNILIILIGLSLQNISVLVGFLGIFTAAFFLLEILSFTRLLKNLSKITLTKKAIKQLTSTNQIIAKHLES